MKERWKEVRKVCVENANKDRKKCFGEEVMRRIKKPSVD